MRTAPETATQLRLTTHANLRFAQRGITAEAAELVFLHGSDIPAGSRAKKRFLSRATIAELHYEGCSLALVDAANRVELIITDDETVVTGYRQNSNRHSSPTKRRANRGRRTRR